MRSNNSNKPPVLMTTHGQAFEKQTFYSLIENRHHTTSIPILSGKRVLGSAYGWLVLVGRAVDADCCLWNPETTDKIQLPRLHKSHLYNKCVLSKPPTEPNCLVLFNKYTLLTQSICRIGDDEFFEYSSVRKKHGFLFAMSSFRGEIYGILGNGLIRYEFVTIDLVGETTRTVEFKPLLINDQQDWRYPQLGRDWIRQRNSYLIESPSGAAGEFLFVTKMYSGVVEFRVFRVDMNEMKCSEELDNIDGLTIFISYCGSGFCCTSETAGSKSNSIYYTEETGKAVRVYDLYERSTTVLMPCPDAHPHKSVNYWVDLPDILLAKPCPILNIEL